MLAFSSVAAEVARVVDGTPRPGKAPAATSLAEPVSLVRVAGVDQHEPSHLLGVARGVKPHMEATDRVAY
jgi:hypothetical protein